MANDKKAPDAGHGTNLKIGGKSYNSEQLSQVRTGTQLNKADEARANEGLSRGDFKASNIIEAKEVQSGDHVRTDATNKAHAPQSSPMVQAPRTAKPKEVASHTRVASAAEQPPVGSREPVPSTTIHTAQDNTPQSQAQTPSAPRSGATNGKITQDMGQGASLKIGGRSYNSDQLSQIRTGGDLHRMDEARAMEGLSRGHFDASNIVNSKEVLSGDHVRTSATNMTPTPQATPVMQASQINSPGVTVNHPQAVSATEHPAVDNREPAPGMTIHTAQTGTPQMQPSTAPRNEAVQGVGAKSSPSVGRVGTAAYGAQAPSMHIVRGNVGETPSSVAVHAPNAQSVKNPDASREDIYPSFTVLTPPNTAVNFWQTPEMAQTVRSPETGSGVGPQPQRATESPVSTYSPGPERPGGPAGAAVNAVAGKAPAQGVSLDAAFVAAAKANPAQAVRISTVDAQHAVGNTESVPGMTIQTAQTGTRQPQAQTDFTPQSQATNGKFAPDVSQGANFKIGGRSYSRDQLSQIRTGGDLHKMGEARAVDGLSRGNFAASNIVRSKEVLSGDRVRTNATNMTPTPQATPVMQASQINSPGVTVNRPQTVSATEHPTMDNRAPVSGAIIQTAQTGTPQMHPSTTPHSEPVQNVAAQSGPTNGRVSTAAYTSGIQGVRTPDTSRAKTPFSATQTPSNPAVNFLRPPEVTQGVRTSRPGVGPAGAVPNVVAGKAPAQGVSLDADFAAAKVNHTQPVRINVITAQQPQTQPYSVPRGGVADDKSAPVAGRGTDLKIDVKSYNGNQRSQIRTGSDLHRMGEARAKEGLSRGNVAASNIVKSKEVQSGDHVRTAETDKIHTPQSGPTVGRVSTAAYGAQSPTMHVVRGNVGETPIPVTAFRPSAQGARNPVANIGPTRVSDPVTWRESSPADIPRTMNGGQEALRGTQEGYPTRGPRAQDGQKNHSRGPDRPHGEEKVNFLKGEREAGLGQGREEGRGYGDNPLFTAQTPRNPAVNFRQSPEMAQTVRSPGTGVGSASQAQTVLNDSLGAERPVSPIGAILNVVAGKVPAQGVSLGVAHFNAIAVRQKAGVGAPNIQTGSMLDQAAVARTQQAILQNKYAPTRIIQNTGIESKASFYEAMGRYRAGAVPLTVAAGGRTGLPGALGGRNLPVPASAVGTWGGKGLARVRGKFRVVRGRTPVPDKSISVQMKLGTVSVVAGQTPAKGLSLTSARLAALAVGVELNVKAGNIQRQFVLQRNFVASRVTGPAGPESRPDFYKALARYRSKTISLSRNGGRIVSAGADVKVVAGKVPAKGLAISKAYFTANSVRRQIRLRVAQTYANRMLPGNVVSPVQQAVLRGKDMAGHVLKGVGAEAKNSFYAALLRYPKGKIPLARNLRKMMTTGGAIAVGKTQAALSSQDDMGSQQASGALAVGTLAYSYFRLAQSASPLVNRAVTSAPSTITRVGKGVWDVTTTAGRATVTMARTAQIVRPAFIPYNSQLTKNVLLRQAQLTGLANTATSQRIVGVVRDIQTRVNRILAGANRAVTTVKTGITVTTQAAQRTYVLVRGLANGTIMTSYVAHQTLLNIQRGMGVAGGYVLKAGVAGLKVAGKGVVRGTVRGGVWTVRRGLPGALKGLDRTSLMVGGALASSDDMMVRGVGNTIMLTNYGIKTGVTTVRVSGYAVRTGVKGGVATARGVYRSARFIKSHGLRAAWNRFRRESASAIARAGRSVVSVVTGILKAVGQKIMVPILIMAVGVMMIMSMFSAPVVTIGTIFSGLFDVDNQDGTFSERDIQAYILDPSTGIPALRAAYISDLHADMVNRRVENGGSYHYVRFETNVDDEIIENATRRNVEEVFYTENELANIIQPIFNAVLLRDYGLQLTESQARQELRELFDALFRVDEEATGEYCGQDRVDGSGEVTTHSCGKVHALADCPNPDVGRHTSYTCSKCCDHYYTCDGHKGSRDCGMTKHSHSLSCYNWYGKRICGMTKHSHKSWKSASNPGCYSTDYHSGQMSSSCGNSTSHFYCYGYNNCGGHKVLTVTLTMDGLYQLLDIYFEKPIDSLASIVNPTPEEQRELSDLRDSYEICLEYISQVSRLYGGGMTMEDLSGVMWVNGSRVGNQAIIDLALTQVGQVGGQPYWSWYGFPSRVEWCACFVSWCMNRSGYPEVKYSSCQWGGLPYFQGLGQWASGGCTDLVAGDVIFFDWQGDGRTDHTGLVIGMDSQYVYTVEGNSGDMVKVKQYSIGSSVISGYGLMNY